jgi:hypothetical protein
MGDNCLEEAYNGKHPRLGLILEGIEKEDFVDARFSATYRSAVSKIDCIASIINKYGITSKAYEHLYVDD